MSTHIDVTGHQVDLYFLGRQLEQQAATEAANTNESTGR